MSSNSLRASQFSHFLQHLFGPLDDKLSLEVLAKTEYLSLKGGETLFRQGNASDAAYVVMNGRLRVAIETEEGPEQVINEVGRGETVGEMGVLTDDPRSATVYAVRDSALARMPRETFLSMLEHNQPYRMSLTQTIVERLRWQTDRSGSRAASLSSIALVATDASVPLEEFASEFVAALSAIGSTTCLSSPYIDHALDEKGISQISAAAPAASRLNAWIESLEESNRYVIYRSDLKWSHWTHRCVRQADIIVLVGSGTGSPEQGDAEHRMERIWEPGRAPRRVLVLMSESGMPTGTECWLADRKLDEHLHVQRGIKSDYARLARIVTGEAFAVVLGGGGARGLAHLGVLRAIEELKIPIDFVGGTSIGAAIGAMFALNRGWQEVRESWQQSFCTLRDFTWPSISLLRGARLNRSLRNAFAHHKIEDLRLPYFSVATNLTRASQVVSRRGEVFEAVRASVCLPGVFPPCLQQSGEYYVDGGLLNNVPVDVMRRIAGNGPLIAVDVGSQTGLNADPRIRTETSGWTLLAKRLSPFSGKSHGPGIVDILMRSSEISGIAARNHAKPLADLYLEIPTSDFGLLEFSALDSLATRGYQSCVEHIQSWHENHKGAA